MRLQTKAVVFIVAFMSGPFVLPALLQGRVSNEAIGGAVLGWALLFMVGQFFVIRCPHCHRCAFITPSGASLPWTGSHCRHCGEPY
jgi:hypothetical protein